MSSLKLAQAINARGVYSIGKLDKGASTQLYDKKNVHSVISLLLPPDKSIGQAREFNLEKLQELQSKLALISGKDSQGQEDIRNFGEVRYRCSFRKSIRAQFDMLNVTLSGSY